MVCYGITLAVAPAVGPIVGGAFVAGGCGWRWTEYLTGILMAVQVVVDAVWLGESHGEVLLVRKAGSVRRETGEWGMHAEVSDLVVGRKGEMVGMVG